MSRTGRQKNISEASFSVSARRFFLYSYPSSSFEERQQDMPTQIKEEIGFLSLMGKVEPTNSLTIRDNRTGKEYSIPVHHNAVDALAFKAIRAPNTAAYAPDQTQNGLRLYDPGFQNTAVSESTITYV